MTLSLSLLSPAAPPTLDDRLDDRLDNLLLLGIGFLVLIFALIAGAVLLDRFSRVFGTSDGRAERRAPKHRRRRSVLRKHYPPLRLVHSSSERDAVSLSARSALRRNAEAAHAAAHNAPATAQRNLRLVKPRPKG